MILPRKTNALLIIKRSNEKKRAKIFLVRGAQEKWVEGKADMLIGQFCGAFVQKRDCSSADIERIEQIEPKRHEDFQFSVPL